MKKIDIARVPELKTGIGIHGSVRQTEVAGPACLGVVMGLAILLKAL